MKGNLISSLVAILFFVTSFNLYSQQVLTPEQIYVKVNDAVVIVLAYDANDKLINQGSGVVISNDGYIITNYHVMKNASKVNIVHNDLLFENAELIGGDEESDILFIKIPKSDLAVIETPESDDVKIGQKIYAIGSPMGYENTISDGIVSGYRKFDKINLIQITASISPGSSGGAVVNSKGELIGISTYTITEGQNINFAIPIKDIRKIEAKPYVYKVIEPIDPIVKQEETEKQIQTTPKNSKIYNSEAVEYFNKGNELVDKAFSQHSEKDRKFFLEQAIRDFENVIKIDTNYVEAFYLLGKYHSSTSYLYNYEKARKYFNKVEEIIDGSKENILVLVSNREILVEMANFYSVYGEFEIGSKEIKLKVIEIYKKALEQPIELNYKSSLYEYLNDDYINYQISNSYSMMANGLIYSSIYNKEDNFFEAIEYCDLAIRHLRKLSSTFISSEHKVGESYTDIIKNKKLAEFQRFNNNWELFYTNLNRRVGLLISTNNILFLYHAESLVKDKNNIVRVWIKEVNLKEPNEYESDYSDYSKSLYEFDLKSNKYRVLQYISYYDDKVLEDENYPNSEWQFISPETITETMVKNLKDIKR